MKRGGPETRPAVRVPTQAEAVETAASVRAARRGAVGVRRGHRADQVGRHAGLPDHLVCRAPLPRRPFGLSLVGGRAGRPGHLHGQHQTRVRRRPDAARIPAPGPGGGKGGHRRHPEPRPSRVGHWPLDADGADRVRGPHRRPLAPGVAGGHRNGRPHVGAGAVQLGQPHDHVPRAHADAETLPGSPSSGVAGGSHREVRAQRGQVRARSAVVRACSSRSM